MSGALPPAQPARPVSTLYRAVWRVHFMAGLIVLPFLVMMAVTGGLYLFKPELDHLAYRRLEDVPAAQGSVGADRVIANVEADSGGRVLQLLWPTRDDRAVSLLVRARDGRALSAFADPHTGRMLGAIPYGGIMQWVRKIHSLQKFGPVASALIEITAGWTVVLCLSGLYLWWPRGRGGGVVSVRGPPRARVFWRDLHAVTGAAAAGVILFLAVTGMPWSLVWGAQVQAWATAHDLYEPKAPAEVTPGYLMTMDMPGMGAMASRPREMRMDVRPDRPWALEKAPTPTASPQPGRTMIGADAAMAALSRLHMPRPYSLALPEGPRGAYVADYRPDAVERSLTLYLDPYDAHVLARAPFARWGAAAKAIEWGISVHQGQEFGAVNRWVMLAGCLAIVIMALAAVVMWWKRRPRGALAIPPLPEDRRAIAAVLAAIAVAGVIYPLVGLSFVVAVALDRLAASLSRGRAVPAQ